MRRDYKWSVSRIAFELAHQRAAISRRTVTRILGAAGLNRRKFIDPTGESNREPKRIVAERPGHMVHIDDKNVGRIPTARSSATTGMSRTSSMPALGAQNTSAQTGWSSGTCTTTTMSPRSRQRTPARVRSRQRQEGPDLIHVAITVTILGASRRVSRDHDPMWTGSRYELAGAPPEGPLPAVRRSTDAGLAQRGDRGQRAAAPRQQHEGVPGQRDHAAPRQRRPRRSEFGQTSIVVPSASRTQRRVVVT